MFNEKLKWKMENLKIRISNLEDLANKFDGKNKVIGLYPVFRVGTTIEWREFNSNDIIDSHGDGVKIRNGGQSSIFFAIGDAWVDNKNIIYYKDTYNSRIAKIEKRILNEQSNG